MDFLLRKKNNLILTNIQQTQIMKFWTLFLSYLHFATSLNVNISSPCDQNSIQTITSPGTFRGRISDSRSCQIFKMPNSNHQLVINLTWEAQQRPFLRPLMIVGYHPIYSFENYSQLSEKRNHIDQLGFYLALNFQTVTFTPQQNETDIYVMIFGDSQSMIQFGFFVSIQEDQRSMRETLLSGQRRRMCDERHLGTNCRIGFKFSNKEQSFQLQILPQSWLYIALEYQENEFGLNFQSSSIRKDLFGIVVSQEGSQVKNISGIKKQISYQADLKSVFNSKAFAIQGFNCDQIFVSIYNPHITSVMIQISTTLKSEDGIQNTKLLNTIIIIVIGLIVFVTSLLIVKFIRRISNIRAQLALQHIMMSMDLRRKQQNKKEYLDEFLPGIKYECCQNRTYQTECFICLSDFSPEDECRLLYCKHIFHKKCFDPWHKVNESCPSCREKCNLEFLAENKKKYSQLFTDALERDGKKSQKEDKKKQKDPTSIMALDDYYSEKPKSDQNNYFFDFKVTFDDDCRDTRATLEIQDSSPISYHSQGDTFDSNFDIINVYNYYV